MVSTSSSYLWAQHITATITGNERTPNSLRFCIPNIPYTLSDKESSDKTDVVRFPCVGNRLRYSISGSLLKNSNYCQTRVNKSLRSAFSRSCGDCVIWLGARWIQCILPKTLPELAAGESVFGAQPDLHPSVLTLVAVLSRIYTLCWSLSLTPLFCFNYKQSKVLSLIFQQNKLVIKCSLGKMLELETETEISATDFENDDRVYRSVMILTCEHEDFTISKVVTWHSTSYAVLFCV